MFDYYPHKKEYKLFFHFSKKFLNFDFLSNVLAINIILIYLQIFINYFLNYFKNLSVTLLIIINFSHLKKDLFNISLKFLSYVKYRFLHKYKYFLGRAGLK